MATTLYSKDVSFIERIKEEMATNYTPAFHNVTIGQITEALNQNGLNHTRNQWLDIKYDGTGNPAAVGGCVLGQTAHNLKSDINKIAILQSVLNRLPVNVKYITTTGKEVERRVGDAMVNLNDQRVFDTREYRSYERLAQIWNAIASQFDPNTYYDAWMKRWVE